MKIGIRFWISAAVLAFLCAGCSNTAKGLSEDAKTDSQAAAAATQKAAADAKEKAPDVIAAVSLTPPIKVAILADKALTDSDISVSSDKDTVTLSGHVKTSAQKETAQKDAQKVLTDHKASQKLINDLKVQP